MLHTFYVTFFLHVTYSYILHTFYMLHAHTYKYKKNTHLEPSTIF